MELEQIGAVSAGVATLAVKVLGSAAIIRRAEREDIAFRVNNAGSWRVTETGIEQVEVVGAAGSISISGVFTDGGVISNCQIGGQVISASAAGVFINGKKQKNDPSGKKLSVIDRLMARVKNSMTAGGYNLEIIDGVVFVNGHKQVDDLPEGETTGDAAEPEKPKDPDEIEILVPYSFTGAIDIDFQGHRNLTVADDWTGSNFSLAAGERTSVTLAGAVRSAGEFSFDFGGSGVASLKGVSCASGKVVISDRASFGMGPLAIVADGSGKPQPFKIRQKSSGIATFGDITGPAALSVKLKDRGALTLGNVETQSYEMEETGSGDATVGKVTTTTFTSDRNSRGALQMGTVKAITGRINHGGSNTALFGGVSCESDLVVTQSERGALGLGKVDCDGFNLTITGSGSATTAGIACNSLTAELTERGGWAMSEATAVGKAFKLTQTGRGDIIGERATCSIFDFTSTDRGNTTFTSLKANEASLVCSGRGNLTVAAGGALSGSVSNSDRGTVTLIGNFKNLRRSNTGRGSITVV